jgi:hypothetical protein
MGGTFFACKKAEDRSCFKSVGDYNQRSLPMDTPFDSLFLYDNIIYQLIPDTMNKIVLEGGSNLLKHVSIESGDGRLSVRNNNRCNFLRDYQKKITATIHFEELNYINFEGSEPLNTLDTLRSNNFRMFIKDGAGSVHLLVNQSYTSITIGHGYGDFTVSGFSEVAFLNCFTNSYCNARKLKVKDRLIVSSNTQGDMLVNADVIRLEAQTFRDGNIICQGEPDELDYQQIGNGSLIFED